MTEFCAFCRRNLKFARPPFRLRGEGYCSRDCYVGNAEKRLKAKYRIRRMDYDDMKLAFFGSSAGSIGLLALAGRALLKGEATIVNMSWYYHGPHQRADAAAGGDSLVYWLITGTFLGLGLAMAVISYKVICRYGPFMLDMREAIKKADAPGRF